LGFSIDLLRLPYNALALRVPCECVMVAVAVAVVWGDREISSFPTHLILVVSFW